jgi:TPR repeat protein
MKWLATLGLALLLPAAHATTAVVLSESTGRYGVAWNEPGKEAAIQKATEDCRYRGGGKDCKPVKISDTPGFGTVAQTCAGGFCGISIITGRRSEAEAERDAVKDCNANYGTRDCLAYDRWEERGKLAAAPIAPLQQAAQAAPRNNQESSSSGNRRPNQITARSNDKSQAAINTECNSGRACVELGAKYLSGEGVQEDEQRGAQLWNMACSMGDASGCDSLGSLYELGIGVPKDLQKGAQFWGKACGLGHTNGCFNLGRYHLFGPPSDSDVNNALKWLKIAADKGKAEAQVLTANLYSGLKDKNGNSLKKDMSLAAKYADMAANQGNPDGLFLSGLYSWMASTSEKLSRSDQNFMREQARTSLRKSADKGNDQAKEHLCKYFRERC